MGIEIDKFNPDDLEDDGIQDQSKKRKNSKGSQSSSSNEAADFIAVFVAGIV